MNIELKPIAESKVRQLGMPGIVDPTEAPDGFYAIPKSEARTEIPGENLCRACDYRPQCNGLVRCMSYEVITCSGETLSRADGCSVVFKRSPK